ncbi:MAG: hypothetical protein OXP11_08710 [Gammaproteobacteria bacterium]|nr:hypothetical protein [Gammaproteobacteria bacterium]
MLPATTYERILQHLDASHGPGVWLCALLFAPLGTEIGRSIMDRLDDWHHRSGENIDFFCVGYTEHSDTEDAQPIGLLTDHGERRTFYYSASAFDDIRRDVSAKSKWQYSGEADLILVNAVQLESGDRGPYHPRSHLVLDEIIALDIQLMITDRVYASAARLMEGVCRAADDAQARGSEFNLTDFSDREFFRTLLRQGLQRLVRISGLQGVLGARHFLVGRQLFPDLG